MDTFEANVNGQPLTISIGKVTASLPEAPATVDAGVRSVVAGIARQLAAQIAPQLPEPRPAHRTIERDERGQIVGMDERPADPPRSFTAAHLARQIAAQYEPRLRASVARLVSSTNAEQPVMHLR